MNIAINPVAEKVLRLLLEKGPEAASEYVRSELEPQVASAQKAYDDAKNAKMVAENIIALSSRPQSASIHPAVERNEPLSLASSAEAHIEPPAQELHDEQRRAAILAVANEIADRKPQVTTVDVVIGLSRRGLKMAGARPGTSVGNVLLRAPGWVRLGEGTFKREDTHA